MSENLVDSNESENLQNYSEEQLFKKRTDLSNFSDKVEKIENEIAKVLVGQKEMLQLLVAGLLSGGHILIEGVPGVAKTLTAYTIYTRFNTKRCSRYKCI
jgi:MoxR-like ATPase